jgi:hypothetical protein
LRRAVAQLSYALVLVAPIGAGVYAVQSSLWLLEMDRTEGFWETVAAALPVLLGGVLFPLRFALFADIEGKWGITRQ